MTLKPQEMTKIATEGTESERSERGGALERWQGPYWWKTLKTSKRLRLNSTCLSHASKHEEWACASPLSLRGAEMRRPNATRRHPHNSIRDVVGVGSMQQVFCA